MNDSQGSHGKQFAGRMHDEVREAMLASAVECVFIWGTRDGSGTGTVMSCLWRDGRLWLTTNDQRPRVRSIARTGRAAAVINGTGTLHGSSRCITLQGDCRIHTDDATRSWFFPAFCHHILPDNAAAANGMLAMLDRPGQVILELVPEKVVAYDGQRVMERLSS